MTRRSFESTPLIEAVIDEIKRASHGEKLTTADAIEWILLDIGMYPDDVPASGRMSPTLHSILRRAYRQVGGEPGDIDNEDRSYRGAFLDRTKPRVVGSET